MKLLSAPESMRVAEEGNPDEPGLLTSKDRKRGNGGLGHNTCTVSDLYSSDVNWGAALPFPAA